MSESIKNHEATVMRMAGNIAAGLLGHATYEPLTKPDHDQWTAEVSVRIARAIVAEVQRTAPKETPHD